MFDKESREYVKEYFEVTLRYILLIDNDLKNKKSGQLSKKIELSTLVEQRGVISNFFESDLRLLQRKDL